MAAASCGRKPADKNDKSDSREAATAITSAAAASRLKFRFDSDPWADDHGYVLSPLRG